MSPAPKATKKPAKKAMPKSKGFTDEEKAAMLERVREMKAAADEVEGEKAVRGKLATMPAADRALGERIHAVVRANAPDLTPRLWYGMPAYTKDGDVVCFYQNAGKFKMRYAMLGFSDEAHLDEGHVWPVYFAVTELTAADEAKIAALVRKAVS